VRHQQRPVLPWAAGLASAVLSGLLGVGWAIARRAGLSGHALRF